MRHTPDPLWGDGFVDDDFATLSRTCSWDLVTRDEAVRLFPNLVPRGDRVEPRIGDWLSCAIAERLSGHDTDEAREPEHRAGFEADLAVMRQGLAQALAGTAESADPFVTGRFAHAAGIHPAYIWPSAAAWHERDTSLGWLGVLRRRHRALMPAEVAAYFAATLSGSARGEVRILDPLMDVLAGEDARLPSLLAAARQRGAGDLVELRRPPRRRWLRDWRRTVLPYRRPEQVRCSGT